MSQKRQSPGKRANAARAQNQSIRTRKATTALGVFSHSARVAGAAVQHGRLQVEHAQALPSLLETPYSRDVAAKSVTDLGRSNNSRRTGAHHQIAGAFFASAAPCYGSCARDTFGCAGCLESRSANPRTAATIIRLAANGGSSSTLGAPPMKRSHALNPSPRCIRAAAHKAMALAALHANSSLSTRLARYNHHMQRARALEATLAPAAAVTDTTLSISPATPTDVAPVATAVLEVRHG